MTWLEQVVNYLLLLVITACRADLLTCSKSNPSDIARLKESLFCNYEIANRPFSDSKTAVQVQVTLHVNYIRYDTHRNTIIINNYLLLSWDDERLKWNPADYASTDSIEVSEKDIWVPDLSIYNKNDLSENVGVTIWVKCLVTSNGHVECIAPSQHSGLCLPDLTWYPFDSQSCTLRYGSWIHQGEEINITLSSQPIITDLFVSNPEWKVLNISCSRDPGIFQCCPNETFPSLWYTFLIQRNTGILRATIVTPSIVLVFITLTTLLMDMNSPERINVAAFNLVCHLFYVHHIYWQIPISKQKPMIVLFFRDSTLLCSILIVLTVVFRWLAQIKRKCPSTIDWVLNSYVGQAIATFQYSIQKANKNKEDEELDTILDSSKEVDKRWLLFSTLLNRLTVVTYCVVYFVLLIKCIP